MTEPTPTPVLQRLYDDHGQSAWLDNLQRSFVTTGQLAELVDSGVRGLTSNPTIFHKAIAGSDAYDDQFRGLVGTSSSVVDRYWELVLTDIEAALDVFADLYDSSGGTDGFVSVEVDPGLATDAEATIRSARALHERVERPNLLVKIPATEPGVSAIRQMISEGRSINVTLIFSLERYQEVMDAYLDGLEAYAATPGADLSKVASVASFFISRVDTEIDRRLEEIGTNEALALRGKAAVAQAKLAYQAFRRTFAGGRWEALAARGARLQRPLWASTSTKNPEYPDTAYVDNLIGPDTVNTMPDTTLEAFVDRGTLARTIDVDVEEAEHTWDALAHVGVDLSDVGARLEAEGVNAFQKSFDELLDTLSAKSAEFG